MYKDPTQLGEVLPCRVNGRDFWLFYKLFFYNLATSIRSGNVSKELIKISKVQIKLNRSVIGREISRQLPKLQTCRQRCCLILGVVFSREKLRLKLEVDDTENRK